MEIEHPEVDFESTLIEIEPKFLLIGPPLSSVDQGHIKGDESGACCDKSESQVNPETHHCTPITPQDLFTPSIPHFRSIFAIRL
jgi:hypothetical protein